MDNLFPPISLAVDFFDYDYTLLIDNLNKAAMLQMGAWTFEPQTSTGKKKQNQINFYLLQ